MPLYDCMLLFKPLQQPKAREIITHKIINKEAVMDLARRQQPKAREITTHKMINKEAVLDLVSRVSKHVYARNGVLTDIKSYGKVQLGYGIKKLDGRYFEGQLMQMTMMVTPNFNKELHYLNKEDRLLRWLLVKHRNTKIGLEFISEDDGKNDFSRFTRSDIEDIDDEEDDDDDDDDDDEEYRVEGDEIQEE